MDMWNAFSKAITGIALEDWVFESIGVLLGTLILSVVVRRLLRRLQPKLESTQTMWDDALSQALRGPIDVLIWIVGMAFALQIIENNSQATLLSAVAPLRDLGIIVTVTWFGIRFIRSAEIVLIRQRETQSVTLDRTTFDAIAKLLRVSVILIATLAAMQTFGFSISGVLAFGGIGGVAIGFAAKDLLANFFGGLMIYLDRPFVVDDWIRSPDRQIEGTVERIGWRLTVIRTFDTRPLYIPNSAFTTIAVQNVSRMSHREISEIIGLRYEDADKMANICLEVKEMLLNHPAIDTSETVLVSLNTFGSSSLDFFIYCLSKTRQWASFHEEKQDILLRVIGIIHAHGAELAVPRSIVQLSEPSTRPGTLGPSPGGLPQG